MEFCPECESILYDGNCRKCGYSSNTSSKKRKQKNSKRSVEVNNVLKKKTLIKLKKNRKRKKSKKKKKITKTKKSKKKKQKNKRKKTKERSTKKEIPDIAIEELKKEERTRYVNLKIDQEFQIHLKNIDLISIKELCRSNDLTPDFKFYNKDNWKDKEKDEIIEYILQELTYTKKRNIVKDRINYWIEYFNPKPFTFPRIHGFKILIDLLGVLKKSKKIPFTQSDADEALLKLETAVHSLGGKARDIIKLCRWYGLITAQDIDERPLKNQITRKGYTILEIFSESIDNKDKTNFFMQEILLSCKFYPFFWINEKDQLRMNDHQIRPFFLCVKLMNKIDEPISNLQVYLTVFRSKREDLIPNQKMLEIFDSISRSVSLDIEKTRFETVLEKIRAFVNSKRTYKSFKKDFEKTFVRINKNKAIKGFSIFRSPNGFGHKLIKLYYDKKISWPELEDQLRLHNIKKTSGREAGPFMAFLSEANIVEKIKDGYVLTEIFKQKLDYFISNKPTIWYYDIIDELGNEYLLYLAYLIEFLNALFIKEKDSTLLIKIQDLTDFFNGLKIKKTNLEDFFSSKPLNFLEKTIDFLAKYEAIYKIGNKIKVSGLIDFNIEYDIPRYFINYNSVMNLIKEIEKRATEFDKYESGEYISHIDFDVNTCNQCILNNNFETPCVIGCREENNVQRMNFIELNTGEWRPVTCFGCENCSLFIEPQKMTSYKYPICTVCPVSNTLKKTQKSNRPEIDEDECISCLLCGISCTFHSVVFNEKLRPKICEPNKCNQMCIKSCPNEGAITIERAKPSAKYLSLLKSSIIKTKFSFEIKEDVNTFKEFNDKINENENLNLNPWVALVLNHVLPCDKITRFEKINGNEMDLCLYDVSNKKFHLICELKRIKGDLVFDAFKQTNGYLYLFLKQQNGSCKGLVVKDLKKELSDVEKRGQIQFWKSELDKYLAGTNLLGNVSPECLWRYLLNYYNEKSIFNLKKLILEEKSFSLDKNFHKKFGTIYL